MLKIIYKSKLCGEKVTEEDMLKKTYPTFHASNLLLQQQYREQNFKKYCESISCLLVAKQNNEFLMKTHNLRLNGFTLFLKVNGTVFSEANSASSHKYEHGRGCGRARCCGMFRGGGHNNCTPNVPYRNTS